jgi:hypothetical protein
MYDRFGMHFFCGQQWKTFLQIKTHLVTKYTYSAGSGPVFFFYAMFQDVLHQIVVLFHFSFEITNSENKKSPELDPGDL